MSQPLVSRTDPERRSEFSALVAKFNRVRAPYTRTASIVIPTYNCAPLLARALGGLVAQTYPFELFEVIVADDGSSDGVEALVAELQAPWPLSLVRQEHLGFRLASIRNAAIRAARNEVIVNLDGDMIPLPGFLEAHMRWFHASDEVATVGYRRFVVMDGVEPVAIAHGDLNLMAIPEVRSASNWFIQGDRRLPEFAGFERHPAPYNLFHGCNVAYLRRDAMEVGLYDEEFNGHWGYEDNEFGYRLWRRGVRFVAEPTALALHQENSVVTFEDRVKGDEHNFEIACRKIPGFREFKKRLRDRGRRPWW